MCRKSAKKWSCLVVRTQKVDTFSLLVQIMLRSPQALIIKSMKCCYPQLVDQALRKAVGRYHTLAFKGPNLPRHTQLSPWRVPCLSCCCFSPWPSPSAWPSLSSRPGGKWPSSWHSSRPLRSTPGTSSMQPLSPPCPSWLQGVRGKRTREISYTCSVCC